MRTLDNDIHSGLNACEHQARRWPRNLDELRNDLAFAERNGLSVAVAGGRHAMGGQQFCSGGMLLDMSHCDAIHAFDEDTGLLTVGAGIKWPAIHAFLAGQKSVKGRQWAIRQKQTGADSFSLGGSLAANVHGRGLAMRPFVDDVESFRLVLADGSAIDVDRSSRPDIFAAAIGGYGLLGVVERLTLRLGRRERLERLVDVVNIEDVELIFAAAAADGCRYGDFQFAVDPESDDFLRCGIFSRYQALPPRAEMPSPTRGLDMDAWTGLMRLAHVDKSAAFKRYADFYLSTHGQHYDSNDMQMSVYPQGYHQALDAELGHKGSEMISELYVPDGGLAAFMHQAARWLRKCRANLIYGTVRRALRDRETLLPWARADCLCIVFNLHVRHDSAGLRDAAVAFRGLIDCALDHGGSYYLTYHRWASAQQFARCYPGFNRLLELKRKLDPLTRFASNWYRHQCELLNKAAA